ncbi:MAG: hypothetical protein A3J83_05305 [Elusimicrobia bacterium RIFOXYA2_FULL_40_6]|nr:MAG: hypothetical protein A3J83_05305 [Elusimicrobia bacterium RIFOXYA2_FULL_40_6]
MDPKKYIFDEQGNKIAIILAIQEYDAIIKQLNEYESIKGCEKDFNQNLSSIIELINSLFNKPYREAYREFKKKYFSLALAKNRNNRTTVARINQLHRNTVQFIIKKCNIEVTKNRKNFKELSASG